MKAEGHPTSSLLCIQPVQTEFAHQPVVGLTGNIRVEKKVHVKGHAFTLKGEAPNKSMNKSSLSEAELTFNLSAL